MSEIDGTFSPFDDYPRYSSMAPCMRTCDHAQGYNGCDQAQCWCTKPNLELRIEQITRCASSECTFANMNTQTDVDIVSGVQVMYCADRGYSPAGLSMPSTAEAATTSGSGLSSQSTGTTNGGTGSRARTSSGPSATGGSDSTPNSSPSSSSGGLNTAAKAGIAIGAVGCVLLAALIIILLFRRKKQPPVYYPPPASNPNFQPNVGPPQMAPTPYSNNGHGPFSPPPLQQPVPIVPLHGRVDQDRPVSPLEEKTTPAVSVARKEIGSPPPANVSPVTKSAQPATAEGPREVHGDLPPNRHEISNEGQVDSLRKELDGTQSQQPRYHESAQGYPYAGQPQQELDGGQTGWGQRQELQGRSIGYGGQQYGGAYELGPGGR